MTWLVPFLIAVSANLDNLAVGVALGAQGGRLAPRANGLIAAITALATWLAIALGASVARLVPASLPTALGAAALIAMGAGSVLASLAFGVGGSSGRARRTSVAALLARVAVRRGEPVSLAQATALGGALSLNNLATGVAAGAAGASALLTTLDAGALSFVLVGVGLRCGVALAARVVGRAASVLGGLLLIAVGVVTVLVR